MNANMEAKFKPFEPSQAKELSAASVLDPNATVGDGGNKDKTSFRDLLGNSNDDVARTRQAQKNGDATRMAKTDAEFAKMMVDKANAENQRKPQNELDKDAFMKLFVTQMRNQDPLSPDNSSQMAAQLAQFHGLEQMMNVNKNLEKMQTENAVGRAMGLISFVGKDIKLENGKLMVESGKVVTEASAKLDFDAVKTVLEVRDSAGVLVTGKDVGPLPLGEHKIDWDGLDKEGKPVGDGAYSFSIVATDVQGNVTTPKITSMVKVTGVDLHDQGGSFYTALGKIGISEVASVGNSGFGKEAKAAPPAPPSSSTDKKSAASEAEGPGGVNGAASGTAEPAAVTAPPPAKNVAEPPHPVSAEVPAAGPHPAAESPPPALHGLMSPNVLNMPAPSSP